MVYTECLLLWYWMGLGEVIDFKCGLLYWHLCQELLWCCKAMG